MEKAIQYIRHAFFAARPFTHLEDFNRQALLWRDEFAHRRTWPQDDSKTVQQVWQEEKGFLLPAPAHPLDTDLVIPVSSPKTIYLRFDLNDYSIPPSAVGRPLTLVASPKRVRILEGTRELASHPRSYDRHQVVSDPAHETALLEEKRKALGTSPSSRLLGAAPQVEALLDAAFQRGESPWRQTKKLLELLDLYGPLELRSAVGEALERGTPRASSVAFLLARRHRSLGRKAPLPIELHHRPELADLYVQPPDPEIYDELSKTDEEP